jgi:hypothetical protein
LPIGVFATDDDHSRYRPDGAGNHLIVCPRRAALDSLTALCDFAAGSSVRCIARRYRWTISTTEAHIRHAFILYGFGAGVASRRAARSGLVRVVSCIRSRGETLPASPSSTVRSRLIT